MGHKEHRAEALRTLKIAVLSVSTTRTLKTDQSGHWIAKLARREGHKVVDHQVVGDDSAAIRKALVLMLAATEPHGIIITGGTGISPADVTIEALKPLFVKELPAFATLFALLSFHQIDSAAIASRATAGVVGGALVFCLPGSLKACKLACRELIFPELGHLVRNGTEK